MALDFVLRGLACWRIARMLTAEQGPYRVFVRLRELTGIHHDDNDQVISHPDDTIWPLHCLCCTSVYVAIALLLLPSWFSRWMAISMIAVVGDSTEQLFNYLNKDP